MRWVVVLLFVAGCAGPKKAANTTQSIAPVAAAAEDPKPPAPPLQSCAVVDAQPEPLDVRAAVFVGELADQRWFVARAGRGDGERALLLSLDLGGRVVSTPLPEWTERVSLVPPHTLRFLVTEGSPKWWTVDVSNPDSPAVGAPTPVVDLVPGRFPKAFAADATRAVVTLYEANPSDAGPGYVGRTALFEVPSGKRLSADVPMTAWLATCHGGRCFAVASPNTAARAELVELTPSGSKVLASLTQARPPLRIGNHWVIADCTDAGTKLHALELATGAIRPGHLDLSADSCLRTADFAGGSGLFWRGRDGLEAVTLDAALQSHALWLGDTLHSQQEVATLSDGFVVVDYASRSGMMHSPSDREIRRYFWVWAFSGRAGFVPRAGGRSRAPLSDTVRLPHDGEEGTLSQGYGAHVLARGALATAIVVGEKSAALRLRAPCTPSLPRSP